FLADLPRAHEEVLFLAGATLDALLQLVVAPRRAGLQRRDDRRDEPVAHIGSGGLVVVARRDPSRVPRWDCENGSHSRVPRRGPRLALDRPAEDTQRPEGERA